MKPSENIKNKITILSLAVAAIFAAPAQAVVNLDTGLIAPTYARQISPLVAVANIGHNLDVTATLGFGVAQNQTYFIRFDLTNAAFGALVDAATLIANPAFGVNTVVQGGQDGDSFVIVQINGGSTGQLATDSFTFAIPAVKLSGSKANVGISYRLFQDQASAQGIDGVPIVNDGRLLASKSNTLILLKSAIDTTFATSRVEYIAATTNFTKFADGGLGAPGLPGQAAAATDLIAIAGTIASYGLASGVILDETGDPLTDLNQILAPESNVTLTTNATEGFQADAVVGYTANTLNCAAVGTGGTATVTKLTYAIGNTALTSATSLCYQANGTAAIIDQDISGQFNYVYQPGYAGTVTPPLPPGGTASTPPVVVGLWRRDGVELQSPWFTTTTGYISRFFLTNTSTIDADCNVITWNASGPVVPIIPTKKVLAGTQLLVTAASVLPAIPAGPYAVRFVCAAPSTAMQGNYVLTTPNGTVAIGGMIRPGTN